MPKGGKAKGVVADSKSGADAFAELGSPSELGNIGDFQKPAGLKIPKEVEWLLSLVQSL